MQEVANNNVYSVIGEDYIYNKVYHDAIGKEDHNNNEIYHDAIGKEDHNNNEIYYDDIGEEAHIYDEVDYIAIEEKAEPIYVEIAAHDSEVKTNYLNSNKEISLANNLTSLEKSDVITMERNEIARLAEQTFAALKSFISRLASSIWNALFGSKNE